MWGGLETLLPSSVIRTCPSIWQQPSWLQSGRRHVEERSDLKKARTRVNTADGCEHIWVLCIQPRLRHIDYETTPVVRSMKCNQMKSNCTIERYRMTPLPATFTCWWRRFTWDTLAVDSTSPEATLRASAPYWQAASGASLGLRGLESMHWSALPQTGSSLINMIQNGDTFRRSPSVENQENFHTQSWVKERR